MSQSSTRLKEQVAGSLLDYWKEDLKGGKSKICAVFLDGQTFQNVLIAEAWSDADQAHAEKHLKPLLGQVVALENGKIASKGKTTVFHGKQIKLSYDKSTVVKEADQLLDSITIAGINSPAQENSKLEMRDYNPKMTDRSDPQNLLNDNKRNEEYTDKVPLPEKDDLDF